MIAYNSSRSCSASPPTILASNVALPIDTRRFATRSEVRESAVRLVLVRQGEHRSQIGGDPFYR